MTTATRPLARYLAATPAYLGSKKKLLQQISAMMPPPSEAPSLVDPFCGSCAVSLWAKRRGYAVLASDVAERAALVARALIANDRVRLGREDLVRLYTEQKDEPGFIERLFAGSALPTKQCRFLDRAFNVAHGLPEPKRSLTLLVLMRFTTELRPAANWGARRIIEQLDRREFDEMNRHFLRDRLVRLAESHPLPRLDALRRRVNTGVFGNGQANRASQGDAVALLRDTDASIFYGDPPYGSTAAYERALQPLDTILAGRPVDGTPSRFSGRRAIESLEELFDAARHVPTWVISYGNAIVSGEELGALVRRFKPHVAVQEIRYAHLRGLASEESAAGNRELLVRAWG